MLKVEGEVHVDRQPAQDVVHHHAVLGGGVVHEHHLPGRNTVLVPRKWSPLPPVPQQGGRGWLGQVQQEEEDEQHTGDEQQVGQGQPAHCQGGGSDKFVVI